MAGDVYVDIQGLRSAAATLSAAGEHLGGRLQAALDRVRVLSAANPASNDSTGQAFHQNYDANSAAMQDNAPKIAQGLGDLGSFAGQAADSYADLDNTAAKNIQDVSQGFGAIPGISGGSTSTGSTSGGRH